MAARTLIAIRQNLLAALVVLPVLVMSIFPQGTMAARGAQGMEVVLCTGNGPLTVVVDEEGAPVDGPHIAAECGWWLLGQSLCDTTPPGNPAPAPIRHQRVAGVEMPLWGGSQVTVPYPARASPSV